MSSADVDPSSSGLSTNDLCKQRVRSSYLFDLLCSAAVVSKTKTPTPKTEDPLENEDPTHSKKRCLDANITYAK